MGKIITRSLALALIKSGDAKAESLVFDEYRSKTYMAITRYDVQRTDHYLVGNGDLRDTATGHEAEAKL